MENLDAVVAAARARGDRLGWFAAMYGQTTRTVRDRVVAGRFDDAERMCRFVERFAARYLAPLAAWQDGSPVPKSWRIAFQAGAERDTVILQHLLLGINAHVNLDLAIVAAEVCPGEEIDALRDDFMRVNEVLGALMPRVRACIGRFSPLLDVLDRVGGGEDDEVLNFSIKVARDEAWSQALTLAVVDDPARRQAMVDSLDRRVAVLAKLVVSPGGLLQRAVDLVAATESDDVVAVLDALTRVTLDGSPGP
ncbi:MAG TPA: DUF5995 family protein [Acidimicrobiales bacterium]|nr:DUF5995 family protein [Acidimicrobiales bacterium]